jgi:nicotinate-nucleotide--dimethylbenzimidazole phosphoribosyltransferase
MRSSTPILGIELNTSTVANTVIESDILLKLIRERRSIRVFKPDPVPNNLILKILEAGRWAPSGANGQPWELVVVQDREKRAKLAEILQDMGKWERENEPKFVSEGHVVFPINSFVYAKTVPVFIIVVLDPKLKKISIQVGDGSDDRIYRQSVGHLIQNMWLMAHSLGLATVDVTVRRVQDRIKELFDIPAELEVSDILPIGYSDQKRSKDRRPLEAFVHYERFDRSKLRTEKDIDKMRSNLNTLAYMSFGKVATKEEERE